jgi:hypothetical protein
MDHKAAAAVPSVVERSEAGPHAPHRNETSVAAPEVEGQEEVVEEQIRGGHNPPVVEVGASHSCRTSDALGAGEFAQRMFGLEVVSAASGSRQTKSD